MMNKYFSIGELKVSLDYENGPYEVLLDKALGTFAVGPVETPDIRFHVDSESPFPALDSYRTIFTSNPEGLWTMLEDTAKSHYIIALQNIVSDTAPYRIIRTDRRFSDFVVFTRPNEDNAIFPLEYPLADLAVSGHININRIGIILHSACISVNGKGYLFAGVSGAGKSTISEIWQKDGEAEVLTDERVLIRELNNELWAYGTPWHGTSEIHRNAGAPIGKIFFIKHGKENKATPLSKTDATNRLLVRCFPTFWNRGGMQFSVDFCSRVAAATECSQLEFVNNASVVKYVKKLDG